MQHTLLEVPDVLGRTPETAETFLSAVEAVHPGGRIILNLSGVSWICPYGAVLLLGVCRYLAQLCHEPVQLVGLRDDIHAYLHRIDFFDTAQSVATISTVLVRTRELSRSPSSSNVLEFVSITNHAAVYEVGQRARRILDYWLVGISYDIDQIISVLAEACSNVVDHGGDIGVVTVQKYERLRYIDVEIAIADLGIGVRRSLLAVHGAVSDTCSGFIERALAGLSARSSGRGGQGLGAIRRIATTSGGSLVIRSETGMMNVQATGTTMRDGLAYFPGTQVGITFRSQKKP